MSYPSTRYPSTHHTITHCCEMIVLVTERGANKPTHHADLTRQDTVSSLASTASKIPTLFVFCLLLQSTWFLVSSVEDWAAAAAARHQHFSILLHRQQSPEQSSSHDNRTTDYFSIVERQGQRNCTKDSNTNPDEGGEGIESPLFTTSSGLVP